MDSSVLASTRQFFSDCPDGSSLLTVKGARVAGVTGNTVFAVVQFEYTSKDQAGSNTYGTLPSPIAVVTLDQKPTNRRTQSRQIPQCGYVKSVWVMDYLWCITFTMEYAFVIRRV